MKNKEQRIQKVLLISFFILIAVVIYLLLKRKELGKFPDLNWQTIVPTLRETKEKLSETKEKLEKEKEIKTIIEERYLLFPLFGFATEKIQ